MANNLPQLNNVFQALADPTRRAVISQLGNGPASVSALAEPFAMALPSFMKHINSLEACGLLRTSKSGRVRTCSIDEKGFRLVETWLTAQRAAWEGRTDRLEQFVTNRQHKDNKA